MIGPATDTPAIPTTASRMDTTERTQDRVGIFDRVDNASRLTRWGAIVAGAFSAVALQVVFALLGSAIGLSVISASSDVAERSLSIGAGIYWLITGLVSLYIGGHIASRLAATADRNIGATHGFLTWCTVTVLSVVLLTLAGGSAVGGSLGVVGNAMNSDRSTNVDTQTPRPTDAEQKEAAKNAAAASWWTLIALVLGATVATIGGRAGVRDYNPSGSRRTAKRI